MRQASPRYSLPWKSDASSIVEERRYSLPWKSDASSIVEERRYSLPWKSGASSAASTRVDDGASAPVVVFSKKTTYSPEFRPQDRSSVPPITNLIPPRS